jgi:hypothetical protein
VAYKGPARIATVAGWLNPISELLGCDQNLFPEMIVVLGTGVLWQIEAFPDLEYDFDTEGNTWAYAQQTNENLFTLFVHMLTWMGWVTPPPDIRGYVASISHQNVGVC